MEIFTETERLFLREILPSDEDALFELDSDPEVHRYLGNRPVADKIAVREAIASIRQQYHDNGIGRWAVIEKATGHMVGWSGLKLVKETRNGHNHYYDLGYRLIRRCWGLGYATESALASVAYGFGPLQLTDIYGMADVRNTASCQVLQKAGLQFVNTFDEEGQPHHWFHRHRSSFIAAL